MMYELLVLAHLFYDHECCENQHCHPVPCEQVQSTAIGWDWTRFHFTRQMLKMSPDGQCHICATEMAPICIYLPSRV